MTTYYGVWSDEEWWHVGQEIFHTASWGLAKAQAMVANVLWKLVRGERMDWHWEARAIGADGLPTGESEKSVTTDLLLDAEQRLLDLPGVEAAYIEVMLGIDKVTSSDLSSLEFAEYTQGVKAVTTSIREALKTNRADAVRVTNWVHNHIQEDGTVLYGWTRIEDLEQHKPSLTEEQKQIRAEAASHKCAICFGVATNGVDMLDREWWFCDQHEAWGNYVLSAHYFHKRRKG